MTRVLFVGAAGWTNVGDDLIALRLQEWASAHDAESRLVGGPHVRDVGPGVVLGGNARSRLAVAREVALADWVLIGGGGLLDDRRPNFYRPFTRIAHIARAFGTPYGFIGLGVGPINSTTTARDYRTAVSPSTFVHVRDDESKQRLVQTGVSPTRVSVSGDAVTWNREGVHTSKDSFEFDLAINLRRWDFAGGVTHVRDVANELASLIDRRALRVALFAMSAIPDDDDREALGPLLSRADLIVGPGDPGGVERVILSSRTVISMRLHGCLIAAAAGRPVLGIAYDPKVAQQASVLGFQYLTLADAAEPLSIEKALDATVGISPGFTLPAAPSPPWKNRM